MRRLIIVLKNAGILVPVLAMFMSAFLTVTPATATCEETDVGIGKGADCVKTDDQSSCLFGKVPARNADGSVSKDATGNIIYTDKNCTFTTITNTALFIVGALSVVMLIYGGIRYTISGGESGAVTNAKNTILYSIVGIVVCVLAFAVVNFVIGQIVKPE